MLEDEGRKVQTGQEKKQERRAAGVEDRERSGERNLRTVARLDGHT